MTSFSSASLDPPLVSFYIGHRSSNWPAVRAAEHFAVNLMDHGQEAVAARFARKGADRFGPETQWGPGPGDLPLLAGATTAGAASDAAAAVTSLADAGAAGATRMASTRIAEDMRSRINGLMADRKETPIRQCRDGGMVVLRVHQDRLGI